MSYFKKEELEHFLGIVRKYMQIRGALSQKDLAEMLEIGVSTISRFLNQKIREVDPQLVGKIVAKLNIPLHEVIDFVEEDYSDRFIRLVKFFKDDSSQSNSSDLEDTADGAKDSSYKDDPESKKFTKAKINVGGKTTEIPFGGEDVGSSKSKLGIKEKLDRLSPRQKAYLSDFLNLDIEGRDLVVDVGNSLFRYFRQGRLDL